MGSPLLSKLTYIGLMKSIERRFRAISSEQPALSSFICFFRAIKGQLLTKRSICHWFLRLVDRDDYNPVDKKTLIGQLVQASNKVTAQKKAQEALRTPEICNTAQMVALSANALPA